ncbi:hypothetical protein B0I12_000504 [Microbacterium hydrothermale]|uniref:antitoxin VbhA family protein n=1 Tax=Microbacterium hydrothermale TaxID=857427 RepID=UPI0022260A52|nr:antitoxin VbhA family protein [Microbacterium hydrothermale]MCW2163378.1 hypothetical protein [Microbacterium hydrothermale]
MAVSPRSRSASGHHRSEEDRRELAIDTMASWALEGMHPSAETLVDIAAVVDGSVTTDEMIARVKARYRRG